MSGTRLVDESLFFDPPGTPPDGVRLAGGECGGCATTTFPAQDSCPRCGAVGMERVPLPREGRLWAFTVQNFEPKPPYRSSGPFVPYGVGYVDLGPVLVESRLTENDPARLRTGQAMRLCLVPVFTDEDGVQVLTYAFGRVDEGER